MEILKDKIKNNPNNPIIWKELGELLCDKNKPVKALRCYKRANELTPCNILQKKICLLEEELNIDTEDEEEFNKEIDKTENSLGISSEYFFNSILENNMIKDKLSDHDFQQKILNNGNNPNIIFEDNEIMSVMKEMMNVYKKDS
jgi:tetratricopeptide (TPR) repeat protein